MYVLYTHIPHNYVSIKAYIISMQASVSSGSRCKNSNARLTGGGSEVTESTTEAETDEAEDAEAEDDG